MVSNSSITPSSPQTHSKDRIMGPHGLDLGPESMQPKSVRIITGHCSEVSYIDICFIHGDRTHRSALRGEEDAKPMTLRRTTCRVVTSSHADTTNSDKI